MSNKPFPDHSCSGKFVQLYCDDEAILLVDDIMIFHCNMLAGFLKNHGIEFKNEKLTETRIGPVLKDVRYDVVGMGLVMFAVDGKNRRAIFHSRSTDYGIGPNPDHINKIQVHYPNWKIEISSD